MEEPILNPSQQDMFHDLETSQKPEDLSFSSASSIQPAQKPPAMSISWLSQLQKEKKNTDWPR